jgi:crotonobetainyl-CoA:carnitine CoA-transferase CaiB-like acyl-CoA transferase
MQGDTLMKPLIGIRVLDFTKVLAGPLCTQSLADMGAEVTKVEPAQFGDDTRQWPPLRQGVGAIFLSVNRNKRSVALDLKQAAAQEVARKLAREADIVVESYGTGVSERLGIDYESLKAEKPDLIYCSISGFGRTGPLRQSLGYDVILQAFSGIMSMTGERGGGPIRSPISPIDQTTGLHALTGILAALRNRDQSGKGSYLEVSLFETAVAFLGYNFQMFWEKRTLPEKCGSGHESLCPYQAFEASDRQLLIGIANDNLWRRFCRAVGRPDLADDSRFSTNMDRVANFQLTVATVQDILGAETRDYWVELLNKIGVPCAPINTIEEVAEHEQTRARGIIVDYDHPRLGPLKTVAQPIVFDGRRNSVESPPPLHGEHTREILESLGYSRAGIEELLKSGVAFADPR